VILSALSLFQDCTTSASVIVDSATKSIIAKAITDPSHPLKHSIMLAIDNVAAEQGGGAWNNKAASLLQGNKFIMGDTIGSEAPRDCLQAPPAKRPKKSSQYLCTSYDVYTVNEPCVM